MSYDLQFFYVWQNLDKLGQGLVVSLELTGLANLIGLTLGFGVALLLRAKSALLCAPAAAISDCIRPVENDALSTRKVGNTASSAMSITFTFRLKASW